MNTVQAYIVMAVGAVSALVFTAGDLVNSSTHQVLFTLSVLLLAGGAALRRFVARREALVGPTQGELELAQNALVALQSALQQLHKDCDSMQDMQQLHGRVSEMTQPPQKEFLQHRQAMLDASGFGPFAELMIRFARVERAINRSLSASADGAVVEAHASLQQASHQIEDCVETWYRIHTQGSNPPIANRLALVLAIALSLMWSPARAQEKTTELVFERVAIVPLSALQLGDAALIAPERMRELNAEPGQGAELTHGDSQAEVLLYPLDGPQDQISMRKSLRDRLRLKTGKGRVLLRLLDSTKRTLQPLPMEIRIESHPGKPDKWPGFVLGAPHGDCDLFTGEIVEETSKQFGIPSVCGYGSRISFLGRWIDVNRPLQRRPAPASYGILPYRDWTAEALSVFHEFRDNVLQTGSLPDSVAGEVPIQLYLDFHGHDLNVQPPRGAPIYRNVFECMARGFSLEEIRALKAAFNQCVLDEYGQESPPSYWGNLPEDREYEFAGVQTTFFYSGLGARVYGVLASDVAKRAIHIESPNSMRIEASQRPRTARVLGNFMQILRDDLLSKSLKRQTVKPPEPSRVPTEEWIQVPAGDFVMGAPEGQGWTIERPQHSVTLSAYEIRATETTCGEFVQFVNRAVEAEQAEILDSRIYSKPDGKLWCVLWPEGRMSMLELQEDKAIGKTIVASRNGREHHPVNYVTWFGAMAMAQACSATLPTEAQWERAAGWDSAQRRWYRTCLAMPQFQSTVQAALMNSEHLSEDYLVPSTCPVGSFIESRSPVGCYDMSGNVWEWTTDWLAGYEETTELVLDPTGPKEGTMRAVRGGGWDTERSTATPSFRLGVSPNQALPNLGFRLVRQN